MLLPNLQLRRSTEFAIRRLFQLICNLLLCRRRRARPPAVRTTAQPYTAGRPTPPRQALEFRRGYFYVPA